MSLCCEEEQAERLLNIIGEPLRRNGGDSTVDHLKLILAKRVRWRTWLTPNDLTLHAPSDGETSGPN